ncbi:Golgi-associated plant pathogenesis-related protein 1-like [Dermacentor silvarum]|uniref:Golgi-associated plant pathogenesis-related protein 1-like n=1 Tax=Dermacentor silvarum TaxID=543639 RepID=UPI00210165E3|nr:Golgi-associated plant pathogenesis-related protein 1-like [Dermacentor silvarum]XP_049528390.1 Golgi-associated plant pathogenesis-related protein 1-like [Dermacentor silvarum]
MTTYGRILAIAVVIPVIAYSSAHKCALSGRRRLYQGDFTNEMRAMQRQIVKRHNHYRRLHGVPILRKSEKLNRIAQGWAEHLADIDGLSHLRGDYGENLYFGSSGPTRLNGKSIVDRWYMEICHYDYRNPIYKPRTGHFTQVVWKATRRIGIGFATSSNGNDYVACFYTPGANVPGAFSDNVPEPINGLPSRKKCQARKEAFF